MQCSLQRAAIGDRYAPHAILLEDELRLPHKKTALCSRGLRRPLVVGRRFDSPLQQLQAPAAPTRLVGRTPGFQRPVIPIVRIYELKLDRAIVAGEASVRVGRPSTLQKQAFHLGPKSEPKGQFLPRCAAIRGTKNFHSPTLSFLGGRDMEARADADFLCFREPASMLLL